MCGVPTRKVCWLPCFESWADGRSVAAAADPVFTARRLRKMLEEKIPEERFAGLFRRRFVDQFLDLVR